MSFLLNQKSRVCAELVSRSARSSLLTSTALATALVSISSAALANDVTVNGFAAPDNSPAFILVAPGNFNTVVNINTTNLTGPGLDGVRVIGLTGTTILTVDAGKSISGATVNGAYITSSTGNITASISGDVTSAGNGVVFDSRFLPDGGNIKLSGTGNLGHATNTLAGAWLLSDTGAITMDGFNTIQGGTFGILVNINGTLSGTKGSDVNLGMTAALGTITARAGSGIYVDQAVNLFGDGAINIKANDINATLGYGIRTIGWTGKTTIAALGDITSTLAGVYATSSTGAITIAGDGANTVKAAPTVPWWRTRASCPWAAMSPSRISNRSMESLLAFGL